MGTIRRKLQILRPDESYVTYPLRSASLGETDAQPRWVELTLEHTVALPEDDVAVLFLEADPPWFFPHCCKVFYPYTAAGEFKDMFPARVNGRKIDSSICLAVVYRSPVR